MLKEMVFNFDFSLSTAKKCEAVSDPFYGEASCEGYIVGKKCQFTCSNGFELTGPRERVCQPNGKWSGSNVKCLRKYT